MANNDYITTDCKLTVSKNTAKLDEEIFLYKNDRNIKLLIEIVDNKYRYKSDDLSNLLVKYKASYAQVKWYKNAEVKKEFPIQATDDGKVVFVIEGQLIDEDTELGDYDLQLRLLNESQESIRSLPIIKGAVHILKPLFEEGDIATVNSAVADVSMLSLDGDAIDTYNSDGTYNQTNWGNGDVISSAKLNKLEKVAKDNVDKVNKMPAKSIVEGGKIYLAKEDGTKLDSGTELPAGGSTIEVVNNLESDSTTAALSAAQGKVLNTQYKDIANYSLVKHTDGKVYIKKQDGTLVGTGVEVGNDTDLSKVSMTMSGQTLKLLNNGVQITTVEIPTAVVTDEQLTSIIQSKIDDGTLTSIALGDNSVKENNIQDGVVTPNKTNFFQEINHNLLNGKTIKKSSNNSIEVVEYIEVNTNTLYIETKIVYDGIYKNITCYDDNYKSLGSVTSTKRISVTDGYNIYRSTLLENTKYIKVLFNPINITLEYVQNAYMKDTEIIHGEKQKAFNIIDKYKNQMYESLDIDASVKSNIDVYVSNSVLSNITRLKDKNLICELSDVLKNSSLITSGTTLDKGEEISSDGYISDYIPYSDSYIYVCPGGNSISNVKLFCYNSTFELLDTPAVVGLNHISLNSISYKKYTIPNNTAFVKVFHTNKTNKNYLRSSMVIDTEQFVSMENSEYIEIEKKSPFYYLDKNCFAAAKGNFITDDTKNVYFPYIISIKGKGYTKLYTKLFPKGYYNNTMVFILLDDDMQVISSVQGDVMYNNVNSTGSERSVCTKINIPKNTSYFMLRFNTNDLEVAKLYKTIFSPQYITEDENIDSTNYTYLENKKLLQYIINNSTRDIQDDCYKFSKIGKLITSDSKFRYMCWSTDLMHYDSSIDKFVQIIKTSTAHGGNEDCGFIAYINPSTLEATSLAKMYINDEKTNWAKWLNGFVIDGDGNYLVWYYDYENTPRQMHRIISTDKGKTWTDNGTCTMPTETGYFQQVKRLSSGTLLGSYDDGTIKTSSTKTITKIARSTDNGLTWTDIEIDSEYFSVEQHFLEINNVVMSIGRQNAYKSNQSPACITYSKDDGLTWVTEKFSKTLLMHCGDAASFIHDDIVEVFCISRYYTNSFRVKPFIGELNHYIASKEDALQDKFILVEKFYIPGTDSASLHGPSLAQDNEGNVLISYSCDVSTGALPSDLNFLYSTGRGGCRPICCDGVASYNLPYSGAKIENIISELKERITALESK